MMLNADPPAGNSDDRVEEIVARGPYGALALAGVATAIVFALWFAFYFLVFTPRATP
jgi:hypothetical protein